MRAKRFYTFMAALIVAVSLAASVWANTTWALSAPCITWKLVTT